ncbi:MAG TPA: HEAT repeat domain-containing protein [Ktedonobacteraceae bacterium]|nr:HEAT repeat domain-containing protein [Ktedonobacteraceae bacterium]
MPLMQYCPDCWAGNLIGDTMCDHCGASLSENEAILYEQKLMRALHHPVPETRELAAALLGQSRDHRTLPVLLSCLLEETDVGVLCSISKALGQLGDCQAVAELAKRLAQPDALVVALTIVDALATLAQKGCWEALDALKASPPVPERVAREISARLETLNLLYY